MARRVVTARAGFVRGKRMATDWSASAPQTALTTIAASTNALLQVFTPIIGGETVIRIRGLFGWRTDQAAADEEQLGAVGICKVSEPAATIGISAIPTPNTDAAWGGWIWHSYFASFFEFVSSTGVFADGLHRIVIDSKAMRKFDEDDRLVLVVENSAATGIRVADSFRILSKIH